MARGYSTEQVNAIHATLHEGECERGGKHYIYLTVCTKTKSWPDVHTVHYIPQKQPALLTEQDAVLGVRAEKGLSAPRIEVMLFKPQPSNLPKCSVTVSRCNGPFFYYIFEWWKTCISKKKIAWLKVQFRIHCPWLSKARATCTLASLRISPNTTVCSFLDRPKGNFPFYSHVYIRLQSSFPICSLSYLLFPLLSLLSVIPFLLYLFTLQSISFCVLLFPPRFFLI